MSASSRVAARAVPGAALLLAAGAGTADNNTVLVQDAIPADTDLSVADFVGAGSGPVAFGDGTPTSALSYTFTSLGSATDDLSFFSDAACTVAIATPVADAKGVDPTVRCIRVNPKGTFAADTVAGAPSPGFSVSFRVRIR